MSNKEKILLFRCLLGLLVIGRIVVYNFLENGNKKKQRLDNLSSLQKEVSDYINSLYEQCERRE